MEEERFNGGQEPPVEEAYEEQEVATGGTGKEVSWWGVAILALGGAWALVELILTVLYFF